MNRSGRLCHGGGFIRGPSGKQAELTVQIIDLGRGEQFDFPVFTVKSRQTLHLSLPQTANALGHQIACVFAYVLNGELPQNGELSSQASQHFLVLNLNLCAGGGTAGGGRNHLRKGHQTFKWTRPLQLESLFPIRQLLHSVGHANRQLFAANRAFPVITLRFHGTEAEVAFPMTVEVVFALLGEKLNGTLKTVAPLDGSV